jgi:hypothetical protein
MARIRTVKPEFWDDEKMSKQSLQANLIFIALWNFADDAGIVRKSPVWIKSKIFPHREELRVNEVKGWIKELENARMLIPFEHKEEGYYWIRTFHKHQRIDKPQESKIPVSVIVKMFREYSEKIPGRFLVGMEGNGEEGIGGNERKISELKLEDCKLPKDDIGYKVIEASLKLYIGFNEKFPKNQDLPNTPVSKWVPHVRALMQKKGYTYDQIRSVLKWAFQNDYWGDKVTDMEFFERKFEKLKIAHHAGKGKD